MDIINDRRALHRIPEVDSCLPKTMEYIKSRLSGLSCRVFSPAESSLCAFFDFGAADTLAFRADCDALQVQEESGAAGYMSYDNHGIKVYSYMLDEVQGMHSFDQSVAFNGVKMLQCSDCSYAVIEQ